jgi:hypothetical protein
MVDSCDRERQRESVGQRESQAVSADPHEIVVDIDVQQIDDGPERPSEVESSMG